MQKLGPHRGCSSRFALNLEFNNPPNSNWSPGGATGQPAGTLQPAPLRSHQETVKGICQGLVETQVFIAAGDAVVTNESKLNAPHLLPESFPQELPQYGRLNGPPHCVPHELPEEALVALKCLKYQQQIGRAGEHSQLENLPLSVSAEAVRGW